VVQISAHCDHSRDAEPITYQTYSDTLASGAEYAEFDIRKTADHVLVVYHDGHAGAAARCSRNSSTPSSATGWAM
jgi:glycerophosphoryl diester phosphodiesterase